MIKPGLICLLGGGAAIPPSGKSHEYLAQRLPPQPRIAVLETPAGFELNSDKVAAKLANFIEQRLQNYAPQVEVVPARKRGTPFSPDKHEIVAPILSADQIVLGPGSPTYGVRQLQDSLALSYIKARQWQGGFLLISSSATLSFSQYTMPVYEIYKVGEELHWQAGLDYFADYGLKLTIVPHWNNNDGGADLDTSRCYVGQARFEPLLEMLPVGQTVLGLDDHTSAVLDFQSGRGTVVGASTITILSGGQEKQFQSGTQFSLEELGSWHLPSRTQVPDEIWHAASTAWQERLLSDAQPEAPAMVHALAKQRLEARVRKDWLLADKLRDQIAAAGWHIKDTASAYELEPIASEVGNEPSK